MTSERRWDPVLIPSCDLLSAGTSLLLAGSIVAARTVSGYCRPSVAADDAVVGIQHPSS